MSLHIHTVQYGRASTVEKQPYYGVAGWYGCHTSQQRSDTHAWTNAVHVQNKTVSSSSSSPVVSLALVTHSLCSAIENKKWVRAREERER